MNITLDQETDYGPKPGLDHGNVIDRERGRRTHDTAEQKSLGAE